MKLILTYLCCLLTSLCFAQTDSLTVPYDTSIKERRQFETERIEDYRANEEFDYTEKKQEQGFFAKVLNWLKRMLLRFFEWLFGVEKATGILSAFVKILPYLLLATVLYFLFKFFLKIDANSLKAAKNKNPLNSLF